MLKCALRGTSNLLRHRRRPHRLRRPRKTFDVNVRLYGGMVCVLVGVVFPQSANVSSCSTCCMTMTAGGGGLAVSRRSPPRMYPKRKAQRNFQSFSFPSAHAFTHREKTQQTRQLSRLPVCVDCVYWEAYVRARLLSRFLFSRRAEFPSVIALPGTNDAEESLIGKKGPNEMNDVITLVVHGNGNGGHVWPSCSWRAY